MLNGLSEDHWACFGGIIDGDGHLEVPAAASAGAAGGGVQLVVTTGRSRDEVRLRSLKRLLGVGVLYFGDTADVARFGIFRSAVLRLLLPRLFPYVLGRSKRRQLARALARLLGEAAAAELEQRFPEPASPEAFFERLGGRSRIQAWAAGLASSDAGLGLRFEIKGAVPNQYLYPNLRLSFGFVSQELTGALAALLRDGRVREQAGEGNEQRQYRWSTMRSARVLTGCRVYLAVGKRLGLETGQDRKCRLALEQFRQLRRERWYQFDPQNPENFRRFTAYVEDAGHRFDVDKKAFRVWQSLHRRVLKEEAPAIQFSGLSSGAADAAEKHRKADVPLIFNPPLRAAETPEGRKQRRALERYSLRAAVPFDPSPVKR